MINVRKDYKNDCKNGINEWNKSFEGFQNAINVRKDHRTNYKDINDFIEDLNNFKDAFNTIKMNVCKKKKKKKMEMFVIVQWFSISGPRATGDRNVHCRVLQ